MGVGVGEVEVGGGEQSTVAAGVAVASVVVAV